MITKITHQCQYCKREIEAKPKENPLFEIFIKGYGQIAGKHYEIDSMYSDRYRSLGICEDCLFKLGWLVKEGGEEQTKLTITTAAQLYELLVQIIQENAPCNGG